MHDFLIQGGRIIDPTTGVDGIADVAIEGGVVCEVGPELPRQATRTIDARGRLVVPGLVDLHVHTSSRDDGELAHAMMVRAGVTTALDLGGPTDDVLTVAGRHGAGITLGVLESLVPENHLSTEPDTGEANDALSAARNRGALGVKLHYENAPTPTLVAAVAEASAALGSWLAIHCGTVATSSDLVGLRETLSLLAGRPAQIAHINSYCRGATDDPTKEAIEAIELLRRTPSVMSESYLAPMNGSWAGCVDGFPSARVAGWLRDAGYPGTQDGLRTAIAEGFASVPTRRGDDVVLVSGADGVAVWEEAGTEVGLSLPLNPASSRSLLAASKGPGGGFDVDALATDGGGIPRNVTFQAGAAMVSLGFLTWSELVAKASTLPASALGCPGKGRIDPGADADIAIVDPSDGRVHVTIANGGIVMENGVVLGSGTRVLAPAEGEGAIRAAGCAPVALDTQAAGVASGTWTPRGVIGRGAS